MPEKRVSQTKEYHPSSDGVKVASATPLSWSFSAVGWKVKLFDLFNSRVGSELWSAARAVAERAVVSIAAESSIERNFFMRWFLLFLMFSVIRGHDLHLQAIPSPEDR